MNNWGLELNEKQTELYKRLVEVRDFELYEALAATGNVFKVCPLNGRTEYVTEAEYNKLKDAAADF